MKVLPGGSDSVDTPEDLCHVALVLRVGPEFGRSPRVVRVVYVCATVRKSFKSTER